MELYKVTGIDDITPELVLSLIKRYETAEVPRLKRLQNYYIGKSDIKNRVMNDTTKPNNKVANPYAAYIVDTVQGYFLGKPIAYSSKNESLMEKLQLVYDQNHEQAHNSRMGKQISITGIAFELMYVNETNGIKFAMLDPKEVFMIYDNSIEMKPLAAVRFYDVHDYVSDKAVRYVEVYTENQIRYYNVGEDSLSLTDEKTHYFKEVPVICYFNSDEGIGDFEKVIDLIDGYDKAVSDTLNNIEYFADAYLILTNMSATDGTDIAQMKENRVMLLDDNGKAEWLTKTSANMELEETKKRLKEDIHSLSFVPNLSDQSFGNAASGEALKYKLFGLEVTVSNKERLFEKGIEKRIRLITNIFNIKGGQFSHTDIVMTFSRNLPSNILLIADAISKLVGIVSHETLLTMIGIDDPADELSKIEAEKEDTLYENFSNVTDTSTNATGE